MKSSHMASFRSAEYNIFSKNLAPARGHGSPMIEFIAYMSKQYGDNPFLGEEFMNTVVDSQWSKTTLRPFVKVALTLTNCTATKLVDGVAKLITKTDIPSLKAKKFEHGLNEIEVPWVSCGQL